MDARAIPPFLLILAGCSQERIAGVAVQRHEVRFAPTAAEAPALAGRLPPCPIAPTLPAAAARLLPAAQVRADVQAPEDWQHRSGGEHVETWAARDSSAAVFLELSSDATALEISGVQGFEAVPGTLRCATLFAGTRAPFRIHKFVHSGVTPDTLYVAESELALPGHQTLFVMAAGRGPDGSARALGVVATLHLR